MNNPVAFFRLLLHLHSIGYPSHWLSEFLRSVLCNDLKTGALRAKELPIPITHSMEVIDARKVDLAPWVPEFEMLLASTRIGLPFHVRLPRNLATTSEGIGTYEANHRWSYSHRFLLLSPYDFVAMLVFWRSSSIVYPKDVSELIVDSVSEKGRATPRKDFVVVNCLEELGSGKVVWKLVRKRVEGMKREGDWKMAIFRSDVRIQGESFRVFFFSAWVVDLTSIWFLQSAMTCPRRNGEKSPLKRALSRHPLPRTCSDLKGLAT